MRRKNYKKRNKILTIIVIFLLIYMIYVVFGFNINNFIYSFAYKNDSYLIEDIPDYNGDNVIYINNNIPYFTIEDYHNSSFEEYYPLDVLGRARGAYAALGKDLMPKGEREDISMIKPSGWHLVKYDIIEDKYLYNRCHLIAFMLTGENANERNLITCTRQLNAFTMLEYEEKVARYIRKTNNHVLYRVTPIYDGVNLVAKGIEMEALSVEDNGLGIMFNIFLYNVQDGIEIDYLTGNSKLKEKTP